MLTTTAFLPRINSWVSCLTNYDIIAINKRLGGQLLNKSSLEFAVDAQKLVKSKYRRAAILVRAIVIDHPFSDFNKRTAFVVVDEIVGIQNQKGVADMIVRIAKRNITDIDTIVEMMRNANRRQD